MSVPLPEDRRRIERDLFDGRLLGLTTTNAAATEYTLGIMTVVAVVFTPVVIGYQAWTYWVFRRRIAVHHIPEPVLAGTDA